MKATPVVRSARTPVRPRRGRAGGGAGEEAEPARRGRPATSRPVRVEAGGEEERVAEAEQAGVAEGDVVADGEDREHA